MRMIQTEKSLDKLYFQHIFVSFIMAAFGTLVTRIGEKTLNGKHAQDGLGPNQEELRTITLRNSVLQELLVSNVGKMAAIFMSEDELHISIISSLNHVNLLPCYMDVLLNMPPIDHSLGRLVALKKEGEEVITLLTFQKHLGGRLPTTVAKREGPKVALRMLLNKLLLTALHDMAEEDETARCSDAEAKKFTMIAWFIVQLVDFLYTNEAHSIVVRPVVRKLQVLLIRVGKEENALNLERRYLNLYPPGARNSDFDVFGRKAGMKTLMERIQEDLNEVSEILSSRKLNLTDDAQKVTALLPVLFEHGEFQKDKKKEIRYINLSI
ncbi:hypothetical protein DFH27DRAFT_81606 [Peziza echinospora]|nr:hypothetical protein DFH27DRAFT_81606 [Peziza echinospora]